MSLRRLIPMLFIKNGLIVRSEGFAVHQVIGNVISEAKRYNEWDVDELIYLDISREPFYDARRDDHRIKSFDSIGEIVRAVSKTCFMPMASGGGIRTMSDVDLRIRTGSDKVVMNTAAFETPEIVHEVATKYGSQCVVISVDYRVVDGVPILYTGFGQRNTGVNIFDWISECQRMGAGEILLHAIDRDGIAGGYDIETIGKVAEFTRLPVIASGGAGMPEDFLEVYRRTRVSAVAAGNLFHFTERSYPRAKKMLRRAGIDVR
jgi:cyclase